MTVTYHSGNILRGTTAERTGGTWTDLPAGWIFIEDTPAIYRWSGASWAAISGGGGSPSGKSVLHFSATFASSASSNLNARFFPISNLFPTSTESLVQITYPYAFTVTRALVKMDVNTLTAGSAVFAFRDDGADVTGTALSIPFGSTAEVDSGALSVAVAAGSKLSFRYDTSTGSSGTWQMSHFVIVGIADLI